jgi:hypothetical protein
MRQTWYETKIMKTIKIFVVFYFFTTSIYAQSSKPNIIFILTNDQSSITLRSGDRQSQSNPFGINGDNRVITPNNWQDII